MSEQQHRKSEYHTQRIAVIGNACAGKTLLSRRLAQVYKLPLTHVDSLQFDSDLKIKPYHETVRKLELIQAQSEWIIDGFGPLDILESRLQQADRIVMIDLPLRLHYWWALKRQYRHFVKRETRQELPTEGSERKWSHVKKLFKTIHQIHTKMRPEMLRILSREDLKGKTCIVRSVAEWNEVFRKGLGSV